MNVWTARRTAHTFTVTRGDEQREAVFYSRTRTSARVLALAWAAPRGWRVSPDAAEQGAK